MDLTTQSNDSKYKVKPYNHQLECLNKFGRSQAFALLAEMGTGKTWIVINNMADLWSSGDLDGVLVFAPNGVHTNWTRLELPKTMPDWCRYKAVAWTANMGKKAMQQFESIYDGAGSGELRIMTMNVEALQSKKGFEAAKRFAGCFRRLMIVADESDGFKNPKANRTEALMKLKPFSYYRRIMTGTPINNSPFDAFAQFNFLDDSILGTTSFYAFKAQYSELLDERSYLVQNIVKKKVSLSAYDRQELAKDLQALKHRIYKNGREELIDAFNPIETTMQAENYEKTAKALENLKGMFSPAPSPAKSEVLKIIACMESRIAYYFKKLSSALAPGRLPQIVEKDDSGRPKYRNLDKLSALIAPHSFRVLKSECLDLPEKIYKTLTFELTQTQREVYKKAEEECRLVFENQETPFTQLVAVTKLAQITSGYYIHPLSEEPVRIEGENPKLELLVERVKKIVEDGEKLIVWARYRIEIEDIVRALEKEGVPCVEYHGGIGKVDRTDAIDRFQGGDAKVFVGNQQAGGTGITLVAASFVIYYSNDFSLRNRLQSEDRAHRIGQTKNVVYINLVGEKTIDEAVVGALMNKKDVADTIIDKGLKLFS